MFIYLLTMFDHRRFRASGYYLSDGFKMPFYSISSPVTIIAFFLLFASLFTNINDIIPAVGAIAWIAIFGGLCLFKYRDKEPLTEK
ncbi:hypothetical protein ACYATM_06570 [Lactobacillaceae bacterium Scapto_B20]